MKLYKNKEISDYNTFCDEMPRFSNGKRSSGYCCYGDHLVRTREAVWRQMILTL